MKKSLIAILVAFIVGGVLQIFFVSLVGNLYSTSLFIAVTAGALAYLVWVLPIPLIVAGYQRWKTGKFPHDLFARLTYTLLSVLAVMVTVGTYYISDKV